MLTMQAIPTPATTPTDIRIGDRVRVVKDSSMSMNRHSHVADIRVNHYGTTIYVLKDGGWFGREEIERSR